MTDSIRAKPCAGPPFAPKPGSLKFDLPGLYPADFVVLSELGNGRQKSGTEILDAIAESWSRPCLNAVLRRLERWHLIEPFDITGKMKTKLGKTRPHGEKAYSITPGGRKVAMQLIDFYQSRRRRFRAVSAPQRGTPRWNGRRRPALKITPRSIVKTKDTQFTVDELRRLRTIATKRGAWQLEIVLRLVEAGLFVDEIGQLRLKHVPQPDAQTLFLVSKESKKVRPIPLTDSIRSALNDAWSAHQNGPVFATAHGERWMDDNVNHHKLRICREIESERSSKFPPFNFPGFSGSRPDLERANEIAFLRKAKEIAPELEQLYLALKYSGLSREEIYELNWPDVRLGQEKPTAQVKRGIAKIDAPVIGKFLSAIEASGKLHGELPLVSTPWGKIWSTGLTNYHLKKIRFTDLPVSRKLFGRRGAQNHRRDATGAGQFPQQNGATARPNAVRGIAMSLAPSEPEIIERSERVELYVNRTAKVDGVLVPVLTNSQFSAISKLIDAGFAGLSIDELGQTAMKTLKRLSIIDPWSSVIKLAGKRGGRYRLS